MTVVGNRSVKGAAAHAVSIVASLIAIIPVYLVGVNALKSASQASSMGVEFPTELHLENFATVIDQGKLIDSFFNSMLYAGGAATLATFFASAVRTCLPV